MLSQSTCASSLAANFSAYVRCFVSPPPVHVSSSRVSSGESTPVSSTPSSSSSSPVPPPPSTSSGSSCSCGVRVEYRHWTTLYNFRLVSNGFVVRDVMPIPLPFRPTINEPDRSSQNGFRPNTQRYQGPLSPNFVNFKYLTSSLS